LREKFNPRNINPMPAVKFFARLDLDQIIEGTNGCPSISGRTLVNDRRSDSDPLYTPIQLEFN
jgi:hypothetical protein